MHRLDNEHYSDPQVSAESDPVTLPSPKVMLSNRASLVELMIKNQYFLALFPNSRQTDVTDITNLYKGIADTLKFQMSSYDIICQNIDVNNVDIKKQLQDTCNKYYIDLFSQFETALYPGFDGTFGTVLNSSTHYDNSIYLLDNNQYMLKKNVFTPPHIKYTFDTTNALIRAYFYNNFGTTIPTYLILARPFAIEYEQLGIFNIVYDVESKDNIMNYYNTEDPQPGTLFIVPSPLTDSKSNRINYIEPNLSLSSISNTLDTSPQYKQMKIFYSSFEKAGLITDDFHALNISLTKSSNGSFGANYSGNKTNFVNNVVLAFQNKSVSLNVDAVDYVSLFAEVNAVIAHSSTTQFDLNVSLAMNVITVVLMYKKNQVNHHLIVKRTTLLDSNNSVYMRVFAFNPDMASSTAYTHSNNKSFKISQSIPDYCKLSQTLGYKF
jgi:hypothetical protein